MSGWAERILEDRPWMAGAACRNVEPVVFFPPRPVEGGSPDVALSICAGCDVRAECLEYAMVWRIPDGIWGGQTASQRKALRRARAEDDE